LTPLIVEGVDSIFQEAYTLCKKSKQKGACFRCGRKSHYASECYASTHANGYQLSDDEED
jgi:hypothetical protein